MLLCISSSKIFVFKLMWAYQSNIIIIIMDLFLHQCLTANIFCWSRYHFFLKKRKNTWINEHLTHILLKQESVHKNDPWFDIVHNTCPKPKTANSIITQHKKIIWGAVGKMTFSFTALTGAFAWSYTLTMCAWDKNSISRRHYCYKLSAK